MSLSQERSEAPYQEECFTPKKVLLRSPPSTQALTGEDKENCRVVYTPSVSSKGTRGKPTPLSPNTTQGSQNVSRSGKGMVDTKGPVKITTGMVGPTHPAKDATAPVDKGTAHSVKSTSGTTRPVKTTTSLSKITHGAGAKRLFQAKASLETGKAGVVSVERNSPVGSQSQLREKQVQAKCFTPRKSVSRSPPPLTVETSPADLVGAFPPSHQWELPRTPIATCQPTSLQRSIPNDPQPRTAPPTSRKELPSDPKEAPPTSHKALPSDPKEAPPTSHRELPRTPTDPKPAPPTSNKELPCTPTDPKQVLPTSHVEFPAPFISHKELPRTPTDPKPAPPTSPKELLRTPTDPKPAPPTPHKELLRTPTDPKTAPPTSHKELLRTPKPAPPTPHKELPRTPTDPKPAPPTPHKKLLRTPTDPKPAPPTPHKELLRTPTDPKPAPPTSHKELLRAPTDPKPAPPTSQKELPRDPAPFISHKEFPRTPADPAPSTSSKELPCPFRLPSRSHWGVAHTSLGPSNVEYVQLSIVNSVSSPVRMKPRPHPLCRSSRASLDPQSACVPPPTTTTTTITTTTTVVPPQQQGQRLGSLLQRGSGKGKKVSQGQEKSSLDKQDRGPGLSRTSPDPRSAHVPPPITTTTTVPPQQQGQRLGSLLQRGSAKLSQESSSLDQQGTKDEGLGLSQGAQNSPPIVICGDINPNALPGLDCTEEDLAFLQRVNYLKQYKILQAQNGQLLKEEKAISEEREQLEHTAVKVKSDLDAMKSKYQETVATVNALTSDLSLLLGVKSEAEGEHHLESGSAKQLQEDFSHSKVAWLKKLHQLGSAQVEKADAKLKEKLADLDKTKQILQQRLRKAEGDNKRIELQSKIQASADEKSLLEEKLKAAMDDNSSVKADIESLRLELARLKLPSIPEEPNASSAETTAISEKQRVEGRLKMIVQQCEMYVQHHQMLKELGVIKADKPN